jgi:hypothetical protein
VLRLREYPLKKISDNDIIIKPGSLSKVNLNPLILAIKSMIISPIKINFDSYLDNPSFLNEKEFQRIISYLPSPPIELSLLNIKPEISKEWHPDKNGSKKPEDYAIGSNVKVWWKCSKGDDHEWPAMINARSRGNDCPFCAGNKVSSTNNLLALNPTLSSEWHPDKNGNKKPEDYTIGSKVKVWWKCSKGDDHEWPAMINARSRGNDCPYCSGRKSSSTNNLLVLNPTLASEWHPDKNGTLQPEDYAIGSNVKVWWKCPKGDDHEWPAMINDRSRGSGCPYCSGRKSSSTNNLLVLNPTLASEWHPDKNGTLKPEDYTIWSIVKVWWKCPKGDDHEWPTTISKRSSGSGCPYCSGRKSSSTNNLLVLNPTLASEWHPDKNGTLKPEDYTPGSGEKVWWKCSKGDDHEWPAIIGNRSSGSGCPFCSNFKKRKIKIQHN